MSRLLLPLVLLLAPLTVVIAQQPSTQPWPFETPHVPFYEYKFQTHYRYDGFAAKVNGNPSFSITGPDCAVAFFKAHIVNGGKGNGTEEQVLEWRQKAVEFYTTRFGFKFPNPLPADPRATLVLQYPNGTDSDSVVMPIMLDRSLQARVFAFIADRTSYTLGNSEQLDGGYYLFVGPSGLPAGGTFNRPIPPNSAGTYGAMAIQNVCPKIHKHCRDCCKGKKGQLLLNFATQNILSTADDAGWAVGTGNVDSPEDALGSAFMVPIQLEVHHPEFGYGLCSGVFYAIPFNTTNYRMLHNSGCFFPPPPGYPTYTFPLP